MDVPAGTSGHTMHAGVPYCPTCDADMLPSGPRQHEAHIGFRFGVEDVRTFDVFEGDAKLLAAYEVWPGPGGWVLEGITRTACPQCHARYLVRVRFSDDLRVERHTRVLDRPA